MKGLQEITFNGHTLSEYGCVITEPPKRPFPKRKYEKQSVYGRSGQLIIDSRSYDNILIAYKVATIPSLYGNRFVDEVLTDLKAAFCTSVEYQPLHDTELPDGFYKAFCAGISDAVCTFDDMYEFEMMFECHPFFYSGSGQRTVIMSERTMTLYNSGTLPSQPVIDLHGIGDLTCTVNGRSFTVENVIDSITIDSERMLVYKGGLDMADKLTGDYPLFDVGQNTVSFTGGSFGYAAIVPMWCRL